MSKVQEVKNYYDNNDENEVIDNNSEIYNPPMCFEATWYTAEDMGYTSAPIGASGKTLETAYSIASNYFSFGTILYIEGYGLDGYYRVDDCGGMSENVLDMYYFSRNDIPNNFLRDGRVQVTVYVIN